MTSTREEVFAALDSERKYQDGLRSTDRFENLTLSLGAEMVCMGTYLTTAEDAYTFGHGELGEGDLNKLKPGENVSDVLRKIAGMYVRCSETHGIVARDGVAIYEGSRADVFEALSEERDYQNSRWGGDDDTAMGDFLTFIRVYFTKAQEKRTLGKKYTFETLDNLRKVAGLCVAAMERFGVRPR